jgi:hypothetical protein
MIRRVSLASVALVLILVGNAPAQTVVSSCGQEVKGFASLDADLDCTGFVGNAVTIHGGKLALNGHTLTGGTITVYCDRNCTLSGPGTITGSTSIGVLAYQTVVRMQSVDVTNHPTIGVECFKLCTLGGPATISGNGTGIRAGTVVKLRTMTLSGNDLGIDASNLDVRGHALVYDSTISGNRIGVSADLLVKTSNSSVTGNTQIGVNAGNTSCARKGLATIKGGTVTGNGTDPDCGTTVACADLATCGTAPHLAGGATCDHSYVNGSGIPGSDWDVCTLD